MTASSFHKVLNYFTPHLIFTIFFMHLVNGKFLSFPFGALQHLRGGCQLWDDISNILFDSKGRHTYRFQPVLEGKEKWTHLKMLTPANSRQKYEHWSVEIYSTPHTFLFIMYLFTKFWPCSVAAPYWVLFSILFFLQSYPSCNFIQKALNRLIHLS